MIPKRPPRKLDPFIVLFFVVAIGMSVTIAYQLRSYDIADLLVIRNAQNILPFPRRSDALPGDEIRPFYLGIR